MARNRKGQHVVNWDDEPAEPVLTSPRIQPGDLVRLKRPLRTSDSKYEDILVACPVPKYIEAAILKENDGIPAIDGQHIEGMYLGEKRLNTGRRLETTGHWTNRHKVKGLLEIKHIFQFGIYRIVIELEHVEVIPDEE